ncbi:MAG TPA: hypothetical protein VFA71_13110 [Terriglobales bacterium]|nr:hypothetical protein [Terriglobales bacterium]
MKRTVLGIGSIASVITLALLYSLPAHAQCDWQQQIVSAIKSRLPGEKACSVLVGPQRQMFGSLDAIEADVLGGKSAISPYDREYWRDQEWLSSYARHFGALSADFAYEQPEQKVVIVRDKVPDAFSTSHYVVLTSGLVDWFTQPQLALQNLGLTQQQAADYLAQLAKNDPRANPGPDGLIAITALESAHNLLGHSDAFPLAEACDSYIKDQKRQLYEYEKTVALGKKPSFWARIFSSGPSYAPLPTDERQQQADADSLGNWLAWRAQRDQREDASLAGALRWLALVPEQSSLPKAPKGQQQPRMQYISSMLCSDRSSLQSRAQSMNGFGRWGSSFDPPAPRIAPPVNEAISRFQDFQTWYPTRRSDIDRIARGELTMAEKTRFVNVELEAKPDKATLLVDGKELPERKLKTTLAVGPHVIASSYNGLTREQQIVIFDDGPTKFNIEAK